MFTHNLDRGYNYTALPLALFPGASVKSAEHNQRRIVNEFYVGTLGALVRATATQGIDSISILGMPFVSKTFLTISNSVHEN